MKLPLGEKIDVNLSEKIRKHTKGEDLIQIASQFGITWFDLKNRVYRSHTVSNKVLPALTELIKRAASNAAESTNDEQFLRNYL